MVSRYVLAAGLFGFSGGITNWLAVKMLFDKIPLLYGSGVIPRRFREIRETVKNVILNTFFDAVFLEKYLTHKAGQLMAEVNLEEKISKVMESEEVDGIVEQKLAQLGTQPEGMFLTMMGINPVSMKPMIKPFLLGMGAEVGPLLSRMFDAGKLIKVDKIRAEIDALMTTKLQELTPEIVKRVCVVLACWLWVACAHERCLACNCS